VISFSGKGILLDIEGTTSSVSFVYDVMFPAARRHLDQFLAANWQVAEIRAACDLIAKDAGHDSLAAWCGHETEAVQRERVRSEVLRQMDRDAKSTGLKQLQGLVWRHDFEHGVLQAHVYDDVPAALRAWNDAGCDVRIYSSGSIQAQKLFFGHTVHGNLLALLRGHYDTTSGSKQEAASYLRIAAMFALPPTKILFVSDVVAELDAARSAGLRTALCRRPGNAQVAPGHQHAEITSFDQIGVEARLDEEKERMSPRRDAR
jgi:enolase-phosphatase E1